jgi:hypothetical protein
MGSLTSGIVCVTALASISTATTLGAIFAVVTALSTNFSVATAPSLIRFTPNLII